ncbi:MAG: riboflavin biosynthesis protein RibF [Clostridia bacterium]|nr:riboflavin biosynthesis protein RibF [Clostridia bacterium]
MNGVTGAKRTVVAVGNFDGVHKGHVKLIKETVRLARSLDAAAAVWTFDNYAPKRGGGFLIPPGERLPVFASLGVQVVYTCSFDDVKNDTPETFVADVLINGCGAVCGVCGYNFRFGKGASGDARELRRLMKSRGADAKIVRAVTCGGVPVSSTAIRDAVSGGDVKLAAKMLGRPFSIKMPVVHGNRLGTGIGFPTVNQAYPAGLVELKHGVYACYAYADGKKYKAVCNAGVKPTVTDGGVMCCETHLIGCEDDLYGKTVRVDFIDFIRDEMKFDSLQKLKEQIAADTAKVKEMK